LRIQVACLENEKRDPDGQAERATTLRTVRRIRHRMARGGARRAPLLLGIVSGLLALAAGVVAAGMVLPEWRSGEPLDEEVYRERYAELAARAGFRLEPGQPRARLVTRGVRSYEIYRSLGDEGASWLAATRTGVRVEVFHPVRGPGDRPDGNFIVDFSLAGRPVAVSWWGRSTLSLFQIPSPEEGERFIERLAPLLLHPGESLGRERRRDVLQNNVPRLMIPIRGGARPQHLLALGMPAQVVRRGGALTESAASSADAAMARAMGLFGRGLVALGLTVVLFLGLLLKSRLSAVNGALLALAALASLRPVPDMTLTTRGSALWATGETAVWLLLLWSSAESLLRATGPEFTTSLDALRAGRLGPRGGRSLLVGFAFGAGLAGLRLGLLSLAEGLPGVWAEEPSFTLPVFGAYHSPVADGIALAALVALALAFALRFLPARWAPWAAALALAVLLPQPWLHPYPAEAAVGAVLAGALTFVCQRHGLTALLTAAIVSFAAPLALFSFRSLDWLGGGFAGTAGLAAAVVLLGFAGLSRSPAGEVERLTPPAFVRRIEEERRLRHEMTLLARMQRGLLPRRLPQLAGYEVAARSVLASEAGGDLYDFLEDDEGHLWIAAGDVAGHGYSCAVTAAMTKAALASLIGRGRTPAEILQRIDRVLRAAGPTRTFATLALLRLRPETGEAVLANAGHPFPLLAAGEDVTEVAVPGLPLGMGPGRRYEDVPLALPPGSAFVFFSDGLFEAADARGTAYGIERARRVLQRAARRTAERILEAFFTDWRRHLRTAQALDDTTLVVLKRLEGRS
jgi:hypothetical protein